MRKNISPWIHQLDHGRVQKRLMADAETDIAIIGAGIAGTATAFFALKYTDKKVMLLERFKLAHGATGHNGGQIVSYFECGFANIVEQFGPTLAAQGQEAVENAWELIDEMYTDAELDIPFSRFTGHGGLTSLEHVLWHLKNNLEKKKAGVKLTGMHISEKLASDIPKEYEGLYELATERTIREMLETNDEEYVGATSSQKGCINSALFCQEVIGHLLKKYPDRFALFEHTPINKIVLRDDHAMLDAEKHTVKASRVILCTNGFENVRIFNETGLDIDAKYHHLVSGNIGYMSGYLETMNKPPTAISYYIDPTIGRDNSYFYLTRRPYEYEKGTEHNLISVGGLDKTIEETTPYSYEDEYPDEMAEKIDAFVHKVYKLGQNERIDYIFTWHGLMGYTTNGVRLIGPEPQNPVLLYNLGCNGVGILPSIYGGRKISRHLAGEAVPKSIFDVPQRGTPESDISEPKVD
jgi:glycine/D-amino acid oxidase-like deaminating enzyme